MLSIPQWLRLPTNCVLCQQDTQSNVIICQDCLPLLKRIDYACDYCGYPLNDINQQLCGQCAHQKPAIDRMLTTYHYQEPLRTLLHDFKYHEALYLGHFLAELMLNAAAEELSSTQCLVPVPLHIRRLKQRGFNQAGVLAKLLAKKLHLPWEPTLCQKVMHTPPQASLTSKQRHKNLAHAFQVKASDYTHITLVDDLLTTGSTVNELASCFKSQGVEQVDVWCCARA